MPTISQLIERLLPNGSNPEATPSWDLFPNWPPDLFAVAATLINLSGCYTLSRYTGWDHSQLLFQSGFHFGSERSIEGIIGEWELTFTDEARSPPPELMGWWNIVRENGGQRVYDDSLNRPAAWHDAVFCLMLVADGVSVAVGFTPPNESKYFVAQTVFTDYTERAKGKAALTEIQLPHSLCWMVSPDEAVVQPKVMTPQVGCTLRSFSHHLSLLPTIGEVKTSWRFGQIPKPKPHNNRDDLHSPLNLLLIPYPYRITDDCFEPAEPCVGNQSLEHPHGHGNRHFFFDLLPKWLNDLGKSIEEQTEAFVKFVRKLVSQAESQHHAKVHGVILPEFALSFDLAEHVAKQLASEEIGLEFFVTGFSRVLIQEGSEKEKLNGIFTVLFEDGQVTGPFIQYKHHRWKLDRSQVLNYQLDTRLNPSHGVYWWEKMTIKQRECSFIVFRPGACLAALDCEDLGRIEPVQQAIRSVGANLVICLLLDGAQIVGRWPHRYAMVLADDPGSSVLTLTSIGMMRRYPNRQPTDSIALWKERNGETKELKLERQNHALLLTLWLDDELNFSMDGRSDFGGTANVSLSGIRQIRHPENPPDWASVE